MPIIPYINAACPTPKIKTLIYIRKHATYWFNKHLDAKNYDAISRMVKRGTVMMIS